MTPLTNKAALGLTDGGEEGTREGALTGASGNWISRTRLGGDGVAGEERSGAVTESAAMAGAGTLRLAASVAGTSTTSRIMDHHFPFRVTTWTALAVTSTEATSTACPRFMTTQSAQSTPIWVKLTPSDNSNTTLPLIGLTDSPRFERRVVVVTAGTTRNLPRRSRKRLGS